jgi:hypothetical protein
MQGASDTLGLGGEGGSAASNAAGASYLDAFASFRDEVGGAGISNAARWRCAATPGLHAFPVHDTLAASHPGCKCVLALPAGVALAVCSWCVARIALDL